MGTPSWIFMIPSLTAPHSLPITIYVSAAPNTVTCLFRGSIWPLLLWPSKVLWCAFCCSLFLWQNTSKQEILPLFCFAALSLNKRTMGSFFTGLIEIKKKKKRQWYVSCSIELSLEAISTIHAFQTSWNIPVDPSCLSMRQTLINNPY